MKKLFKQLEQSEGKVDAVGIGAGKELGDRLILHPFLLAIYILLFLYGNNFEFIRGTSVIESISWVLLTVLALYIILGYLLRSVARASLLISVLLLLFFTYGGVHEYLVVENDYQIGKNRYLLLIWAEVFFLLVMFSKRIKSDEALTKFLNLFSTILLVTAATIIFYAMYNYSLIGDNVFELSRSDLQELKRPSNRKGPKPDIYYIILDGYASATTLRDIYDYPDNDLVSFLKEKGFYVAPHSTSNYSYTCLSISSSLNMSHLLNLGKKMGESTPFIKPLLQMADNHALARYLKSRGYTYIHYGSRYDLTYNNKLADRNVNCDHGELDNWGSLLLRTTMLSGLETKLPDGWLNFVKTESQKTLCPFTEAGVALNTPGPKFVFMHVLLPHPPFAFNRNGEMYNKSAFLNIDYQWDKEKYLEQLLFVNGKVKELIGKILSSSTKTPIIVLQSDHGPASVLNLNNPDDRGLKERMTILNAYLLPDGADKVLYPTITPVNSFRIIFNHYFGARFELLEDKSYFSTLDKPYAFKDVTDRVHGGRWDTDRNVVGD